MIQVFSKLPKRVSISHILTVLHHLIGIVIGTGIVLTALITRRQLHLELLILGCHRLIFLLIYILKECHSVHGIVIVFIGLFLQVSINLFDRAH